MAARLDRLSVLLFYKFDLVYILQSKQKVQFKFAKYYLVFLSGPEVCLTCTSLFCSSQVDEPLSSSCLLTFWQRVTVGFRDQAGFSEMVCPLPLVCSMLWEREEKRTFSKRNGLIL